MSRQRPLIFKLFATGLVAASAFLILHPADRNLPITGDRQPARHLAQRHGERVAESRDARHGGPATTPPAASIAPMTDEPIARSSSQAVPEPPAGRFAQAIQLADDVRLPAALLPQGPPNLPPAVAEATAEIANTFYRELQAATPQAPPGEDQDTTLIPKTPRTEQIRQLADEQFRALYGDDRYIQQTLNSAIEVQLPPEPAPPMR